MLLQCLAQRVLVVCADLYIPVGLEGGDNQSFPADMGDWLEDPLSNEVAQLCISLCLSREGNPQGLHADGGDGKIQVK